MTDPRLPLLVILGPTGAGKSAAAHEIARRRGGEIVSADAFAVYRGFDIGTAKPTPEERREVPYHLIDAADPVETFSAGRWARDARETIEGISLRGRLPIVCGGSGFYIEALLRGLPPGEATDPALRASLAGWGKSRPDEARRFLAVNDPVSAARIAPGNLRYVLRAIEILLSTGTAASARRREGERWTSRWRVVKLGVRPASEDLYARIATRVRRMLDAGWDSEVRRLLSRGISTEANGFRAIGYREVADWVSGRAEREETEQKIVAATRALAKRQRTWFAREAGVEWVEPERAVPAALERLSEIRFGEGSGRT
ncbi:MAG TPA: tRNA (adenosine(37)-N6)-dimethylallyltransferase MiaA [Thermoanaerobaculia bacterium]|nr:tRNA (adenosine(37)-N6)-dimethylallyltransferase MiaA [Thermoanaerobaculia bacterium]